MGLHSLRPKGRASARGKPSGFPFRNPSALASAPLRKAAQKIAWGPHVRNPWAEKKAAEPKETPAWIWTLLGAIDPILREDGCVWSDPTPQRPSYQMFCIGKPDPQNAGMILLDNGMRLAVGTHLWEYGASLRINDGTEVAHIPLSSRFRSAVLDYVDGLRRAASHAAEPDPAICEGKIDPIPRGIDPGLAAVVANDDFGGAAAALGMQLYRELTCNPGSQSAVEILSLMGKVPGRGPLRAKPNLEDRFGTMAGKPRSGGGGGEAEHTQPVVIAGPNKPLNASARAHILFGERDRYGNAKGWHHEDSGDRRKGTFVIEETRSTPDSHGVYEANVVIEGAKKGPRSSFFPRHWTAENVIEAVEETYAHRQPVAGRAPGWFRHTTKSGVTIEIRLAPDGSLYSAYPIKE